jgi:hypothetical protein
MAQPQGNYTAHMQIVKRLFKPKKGKIKVPTSGNDFKKKD